MSEETPVASPTQGIKVEIFVSSDQIREDMQFTEASLDEALIAQAALMAYYGSLAAKAQHQLDSLKMRLELVEASAGKKIREDKTKLGEKVTEKFIEGEVVSSKLVLAHKKALNEAREVYETLKATFEALKHKRDAMIQIGVSRRVQMEARNYVAGESSEAVVDRAEALKKRLAGNIAA